MDSQKIIGGFRLSSHAQGRMVERGVTAEEVLMVLADPTEFEQAEEFGLIHYRATLSGRLIRVTVNALANVVVTIVAPALEHAKSPFGWFSLGASLQARQ